MPSRSRWRARAVASWVALVLFVAGWGVFLRPQFLGGPATFVGVSGISMTPTMHDGDLALVSRRSTYRRGDIVAYRIPTGQPGAGHNIIHRIVGGDGRTGYVTRGDHNGWDDVWHPTNHDVLGEVSVHLPLVAKAVGELRRPWVLAPVAGLVTFVLVLGAWRRPEDEDEDVDEDAQEAADSPKPSPPPAVPARSAAPVLAGIAVTAAAVGVGLFHGTMAGGRRSAR